MIEPSIFGRQRTVGRHPKWGNAPANARGRFGDGDACRYRSRPAHHCRPRAAHAAVAVAAAVGAHRRRGFRQIRKFAGHQLVQGARRLRQACSAERRRAPPRRHRDVRRQSCPGGRLSRPPPRHTGDHRHAGDDAVRENQSDGSARRDCRARRRDACGSAGAGRGHRRRARSRLGASLRRSAHHRRPRHHRAGNAGGRARPRRRSSSRSAAAA